ncbi:right-handed parallel beta-helix repeat-containing protein [Carboxylicivirga sediminis]|uniref:Right-handed parallel beta-helix repeat-containing protein n=1 Tax=Carboxylicivirga sediminis TaxID=2006564 RepID=A0A941F7E3_9BACT|nr:right-handed parallel beta-helix repeat-containing protein [Carboxylicivirga sediminis]MBR8538128.1 right-handed parallel beta-helix repeat-containing protein [Carboxylicivirga sediminis]
MKRILSALALILTVWSVSAERYYVNPVTGNDANTGTSKTVPFQTLDKINSLKLHPGDEVLLAMGHTHKGCMLLKNLSGSAGKPIVIASYQEDEKTAKATKPIIDAKGFLNGVLLENCSFVTISGIEISADGGAMHPGDKSSKMMRCGVLVQATEPGEYSSIALNDLTIRDVFFEEKGFVRGADEVRTANGKQNYGWGIRFINAREDARLQDLTVKGCQVENVAHTGLKFTGNNKNIRNIRVMDNTVKRTGGPGIQMSGVHQGHVKGNEVSYSGSNNDSRKWGRGSGLWTWGSSDIIIEHNTFKYANGPGDSAGCHIDYNCNNVIVQYNLSANNAGGFCEILGNNFNCAYRYNVSINDGHRVKGEDGAFQEGKIFWLSGYQGKKDRSGPFNSYFYNNTIYVKKGMVAKIAVDKASAGVLIANNIFYIEGESKAVLGDQYNPEKAGESKVHNIVFTNNLYLKKGNWPHDVLIQDDSPLYGNPAFVNAGGQQLKDYLPTNIKLVKNQGINITPLPNDSIGLFIGLKLETDILGNKLEGLPDLGAFETK